MIFTVTSVRGGYVNGISDSGNDVMLPLELFGGGMGNFGFGDSFHLTLGEKLPKANRVIPELETLLAEF